MGLLLSLGRASASYAARGGKESVIPRANTAQSADLADVDASKHAGAAVEVSAQLRRTFTVAARRRELWEPLWRSCYGYALPRLEAEAGEASRPSFDGTAAQGASELAASLLAEIAPPGARWCGLEVSPSLAEPQRAALAPTLDTVEVLLGEHFAQSNFAVELHQSLLDLVVAGTGCLLLEANRSRGMSALRFQSVPLEELYLGAGDDGDFGTVFRRRAFAGDAFARRWPAFAHLAASTTEAGAEAADATGSVSVIEAVEPLPDGGFAYRAFTDGTASAPWILLAHARLEVSPFLVFRWTRTPGELWGRSPVMQALPEIRTANRVVELSLRNAAMTAVGVWHADDDGVLDASAIRLEPGAIIPRAVGSRGLSPLDMGRGFDLSQVVLEDLRTRIRSALLTDRLENPISPLRRTATEVLSRASDNARILGAHYGRLSAELVTPLSLRALHLLALEGWLPPPFQAHRLAGGSLPPGVALRHRAPLAQLQSQRDSANFFLFVERLRHLGGGALDSIDLPRAIRHGARLLGVPESLLRAETEFRGADEKVSNSNHGDLE